MARVIELLLSSTLVACLTAAFKSQLLTLVLWILVACNLSYWLFLIFVYPFYFSPLRHLPEPKGAKGLWAHAAQIRASSNGEPYRQWINSTPNNGLIRFRVLMNQERLLLTSSEALREVLVKNSYQFSKPPEPIHLFRAVLGNGLLVADGDEHRRQRRGLMPAFSFRHIKDLYPVFWSKAKECVEAISAGQRYQLGTDSKTPMTHSAYEWAQRTSLDIIGLAGMGHDFHAIASPEEEVVLTYKEMFEEEGPLFYWTSIGLDLPVRPVLKLPLSQFTKLRNASAKIKSIVQSLIVEKKEKIRNGKSEDVDILSVALESGVFSNEDLVDQMMTFLAAGHETTASALTWATYLLCMHPEVQKRLRTEIRENMPTPSDTDSTVDSSQLDRLPYLNAVCNEVLRCMPSVPITIRDANQDTEIEGHFIPKGTRIFIAAWAVNVSQSLWGEDAQRFDPDRWLRDRQANTGGAESNFANLTFIHGPRSCIGKDFAKAEFLCVLAAWAGRFELKFEDQVLQPDIIGWVTAKPKHGLPVVFQEIEGW